MKLIIAGGRNQRLSLNDRRELIFLDMDYQLSEVVCGMAYGIDLDGKSWAEDRDIKVTEFPANWKEYGKRAGLVRNLEMAVYADALAVFPGGKGTANMVKTAEENELRIFDYR